jgi:hypothetical protein
MSEDEALCCFASHRMAKDGDQAYFFYAPARDAFGRQGV